LQTFFSNISSSVNEFLTPSGKRYLITTTSSYPSVNVCFEIISSNRNKLYILKRINYALEYCCTKGMIAAEFLTKADFDEAWKSTQVQNILASNIWLYIGMTYDNGDATDTWCHSKAPVPTVLTNPTLIQSVPCTSRTAFALAPIGLTKIKVDTENMDRVPCMK
jgi:hypothetical protein